MERVEYDRLKKRPFAYTDPLGRVYLTRRERSTAGTKVLNDQTLAIYSNDV